MSHSYCILIHEFPEVPIEHVEEVLGNERYFYQTYSYLQAEEITFYSRANPPYEKIKRDSKSYTTDSYRQMLEPSAALDILLKELDAARLRRVGEKGKILHCSSSDAALNWCFYSKTAETGSGTTSST